jgi:YD repeat-containing protein
MTSRTKAGHTIYFNYNSEEQLRGIINEKGLPYHFALDNTGNVLRDIGFDVLTREYTRNPAGCVTRLNRPSGHFTQYAHDANGRVTEVEYQTGEKEAYSYYPSGLLKSANNPDAKVEFKRDAFDTQRMEEFQETNQSHTLCDTSRLTTPPASRQNSIGIVHSKPALTRVSQPPHHSTKTLKTCRSPSAVFTTTK